jgi:hypothetical protein
MRSRLAVVEQSEMHPPAYAHSSLPYVRLCCDASKGKSKVPSPATSSCIVIAP